MKTVIPSPYITLGLWGLWLVLQGSFALADHLLGLAMGLVGGIVYARLEPPREVASNFLRPAVVLAWRVLVDIVRSNIAVARIALHLPARGRVSGFLEIPLVLRDPRGLAVLACIVTATPGTSWAHYDATTGALTLHVLDLFDEEAWVRQFKEYYEQALLEIFE